MMKNIPQMREISTLSFNERVLQEAEDDQNPLMERLKFLGIFSSNMDEFFKVRVASVQRRIELGKKGMVEVLAKIMEKARDLDDRFQTAYGDIMEALAKEGIRLVDEHDLKSEPPEIRAWVSNYFDDEVLPSLVPIILRDGFPMPQLTDGALYFGVKMWGSTVNHALLELPPTLPRFVELPNGCIMYLDDVIRHSLHKVFYIFGADRIEAFEFKISRDAELDMDNDFSEGYVRKMEKVLRQRKGGRPTRFAHDADMPPGLLQRLVRELKLGEADTSIAGGRYHNMRDLMRFPVRRPDLLFGALEPSPHPVLDSHRGAMMDIIRRRDLLLTYPYQSFDHVIRLLREAAIDPEVKEIKMTLYRVASHSQVVNTLLNAARNGKKVFVTVELQARFDEQHNIRIAEKMSEVGITVVYGVPPMKVHSKLLLIRRKDDLICGLSTGNFNETTGRLYVDSMLFTADKRLTKEVATLFEFFDQAATSRALTPPRFKHLLVSPFNARKVLYRQIALEKAKGPKGRILIKANHLTDAQMIRRVREAAEAGVRVDLIIRTTFAMLPHKNIRAISILDRYLEHQRVYLFGEGDDQRVFMSSADLMERNLDWRVEVAFPLYDPEVRRQAADMLALQVRDDAKARVLDRKQCNRYVNDAEGAFRAQYDTHAYFRSLYLAALENRGEAAPLPAPEAPVAAAAG
ncbi:MAG: polyphosphate kinase 1 [Candidatus Hydrogenedentes bacterium]|nr:polyphosphate kinase 1 [Candidatus Hydrogenedentota bacterium]